MMKLQLFSGSVFIIQITASKMVRVFLPSDNTLYIHKVLWCPI